MQNPRVPVRPGLGGGKANTIPMEVNFENKTKALDWNELSFNWLRTVKVLIHEKQPGDIIVHMLHQAIENSFKAVYAYYGLSIPKKTSMETLYKFTLSKIDAFEQISLDKLETISKLYQNNQSPGPNYRVPEKDSIQQFYTLTGNINTIVSLFIMNLPQRTININQREKQSP